MFLNQRDSVYTGGLAAGLTMKMFGGLIFSLFAALIGCPQISYVPGTPSSLSGLNATGIRRMAWEKKLRRDSIRPSVWTALKSAIKVVDNVMSVTKSGVFLEISTPPDAGQSCRIAMRTPLTAAPRYGTGQDILGNEDEQDLLWTELFYNEIKKGVKYRKWGYDYNDTKYLKYIETYADAITEFMAENYDTRCHQALTLTYAEELTYTPVSNNQQFNKNWCIPNLAQGSYPAWDVTTLSRDNNDADSDGYYSSRTYYGSTTFVENIATALLAASGTSSVSTALFTIDFLAQLEHYLADELLLEPIMLDGQPSYVILVDSEVWSWTSNPNNSGSFGEHWQAVADYSGDRMKIPGELGRAYGSLVFVRNRRAPTLTVGGSSGAYTLRVNYVNPGNNDDRNKSAWANTSGATNYVFHLCYALGQNALAEYLVDPLNSNMFENTEYGKIEGRACYVGSGLQIPAWDKDSGSRLDGASTTQIQRGSCIIPVSKTPVETVN